ncbi:hypothetical protein Tco_0261523 [Tanacetum coccineum]
MAVSVDTCSHCFGTSVYGSGQQRALILDYRQARPETSSVDYALKMLKGKWHQEEGPHIEPRGQGRVTQTPPQFTTTPQPVTRTYYHHFGQTKLPQLQAMIKEGVYGFETGSTLIHTRMVMIAIFGRGVGIRRPVQVARECTYPDFLKCQPLNFKGTEGVVGLTRWFEKMESVFSISNCTIASQVNLRLALCRRCSYMWDCPWTFKRELSEIARTTTIRVIGMEMPKARKGVSLWENTGANTDNMSYEKDVTYSLANNHRTKEEDKSEGKRLEDVPSCLGNFPEVFSEDLPARDPYRLAPSEEMKELAEQY